ncbi:hypothetical protein P692DRAFT_20504917 [Suillus brevipes Sb2]|nr:hypothetical protein P692DRAFT_20504917 [Suillus brevipes Sb2]
MIKDLTYLETIIPHVFALMFSRDCCTCESSDWTSMVFLLCSISCITLPSSTSLRLGGNILNCLKVQY